MGRERRPISDDDKILSMEQAAVYLGLTIEELYKLHASGIPHYKVGKYSKYLRSELNAWLTASE